MDVKKKYGRLSVFFLLLGALVLANTVSADLDTGLVLGLHFENDTGIGEDNTHVVDYSPIGNDGTKTGGGQYFNGIYGGFLNNSCVYIPDDNSLDVTDEMTMSIWMNWNSNSVTNYLAQKGDGDRYDFLFYGSGGGKLNFYTTPGGGFTSNSMLNDSTWHSLIVTSNASTGKKIYIDGVYETSGGAITISTGVGGLGIGCDSIGVFGFPGAFDEFRLYNRTLTEEEVLDLYNFNYVETTTTTEDTTASSEATSSSLESSSSSEASSTSSKATSSSLESSSSSKASSTSSSSSMVSSSTATTPTTTIPTPYYQIYTGTPECAGLQVTACNIVPNEDDCVTSYTLINEVNVQCAWITSCNTGVHCSMPTTPITSPTTTFAHDLSGDMVGFSGIMGLMEVVITYMAKSIYYFLMLIKWYFTIFLPNILLFIIAGEVVILGYILSTSSRDGIANMLVRFISYNYSMFNIIYMSLFMVYTMGHLIWSFLHSLYSMLPEVAKTLVFIGVLVAILIILSSIVGDDIGRFLLGI